MSNPFTDHPHAVNETYGQHMGVAFGVGSTLFVASLACFIHGLFPFLFKTTGSRTVIGLYGKMTGRKPDGAGFGDWSGAGV